MKIKKKEIWKRTLMQIRKNEIIKRYIKYREYFNKSNK